MANNFLMESMTWKEVETKLKETQTVLVPVGSTEEHGHHLPLSTDYKIAYEIAKRVGEKTSVLIAPPVCYGVCRRTETFPGTVTITFDTMRSLAADLIESFYYHGIRNIIFIPGHLGTAQLVSLELAAHELLKRYEDLKIAIVKLPEILQKLPAGLTDEPFGHAGDIETSIMLALFPQDVKMEQATSEIPAFSLHLVRRDSRIMMKSGVIGKATKATRKKGEVIVKLFVDEITQIVRQLDRN